MSLRFPHFSRFISATAFPIFREFSLWSILTALIAYNITTALSSAPAGFQPLFVAVMQPAASSTAHINLAQWYKQNGIVNKAKYELLLANEHWAPGKAGTLNAPVLGAEASPADMLSAWENEPARLEKDYQYWQTVIKEKSDYRDAYITLASLAYQLGYTTDAKRYRDQVVAIDPGLPIAKQLNGVLE